MKGTTKAVDETAGGIETKSVQGLAEEFSDRYEDSEGDDLLRVLLEIGRFISEIAGADAAAEAMTAVIDSNPGALPAEPGASWEERLLEIDGVSACEWPIGQVFFTLNAYAFYGFLNLYEEAETEADRAAALRRMLDRAAAFLTRVPDNWKLDLADCRRTLAAAQARWSLDHGELVSPEGLAHLGGVVPRTFRNMMSAGEFSPVDGKIAPEEARAWLAGRSFRPSVWRDQANLAGAAAAPDLEDVLFVPVSRDGSLFHPGLERNGTFTIGEPEEHIAGFDAALERLHKMGEPRWRRPNAKGNWGQVVGVRWERKTRRELDEVAAAAGIG